MSEEELKPAIHRGKMTNGVVLRHDNALEVLRQQRPLERFES